MPGAPYDPTRGWSYSQFPSDQLRDQRCKDILVDLACDRIAWLDTSADTRPIHARMFDGMCPDGHEYFAGHYRGEPIGHLSTYDVHIPGPTPLTCYPHSRVLDAMERLRVEVMRLPELMHQADAHSAESDRLVAKVHLACTLLVHFMTVHPYADGNGHMGRYLVWAVLHGFGLHPKRWPLNLRPADPPYSVYLNEFRHGKRAPLVQFVLQHL